MLKRQPRMQKPLALPAGGLASKTRALHLRRARAGMANRFYGAAVAGIALLALAASADAKTFRWANDGDTNSMDPYARQETFLLLFDQSMYEPLVRRNREDGARAGAGDRVEADRARPSGASNCARASSSMTARRSPPTTSCSRSSARAGDGSDLRARSPTIKEVQEDRRLHRRHRSPTGRTRSCRSNLTDHRAS